MSIVAVGFLLMTGALLALGFWVYIFYLIGVRVSLGANKRP